MNATAVDTHRDLLLSSLDTGRTDDFLTLITTYLQACPDDQYMRLMAVRGYLKLDLVAPARELLDVDPSIPALPEEFVSVARSLVGMPGGAIPWSSARERFERNLASLAGRGVAVAPIREHWARRHADFQWFRDSRGLDQIRMCDESRRWHWIPRFGDHKAIADAKPKPDGTSEVMPPPYLFEGLDLGWHFQRVYHLTHNTFHGYSSALFVVEPDPSLIALVLHLHDWCDILCDPRVFWFVGDSCVQQLAHAWDDSLDLPFPRQAFTLSAFRPSPDCVAVVHKVLGSREAETKALRQELDERCAVRGPRYAADRFREALSGDGPPLRILGAVSTHTTFLKYSMRDAKRAFESLGHRCEVLTEGTPYHSIGPLTYLNIMRDFDPDVFFNIDHLRPEFEYILPSGLPLLTWDQDQLPHVLTPENLRGIGKLDFVAGLAKGKCVAAGCNSAQFLCTHIPTCPEQFSGEPLSEEERERYSCDVSFVSHASQTPRAFHEQERASYSDVNLQELLDTLYDLAHAALRSKSVMDGSLSHDLLDEAARRHGVVVEDKAIRDRLVGWYLWRLGDRVFRHDALKWVADWAGRTGRSFRIYGNGWDQHPSLATYAAGPAENGRELLCIYRASAINLQLMPAGFVHQRALDGLAAGGFFLGRTTPSDLRGKLLRRLHSRIHELGVVSTRELLRHDDRELRSLLAEFFGDRIDRIDPDTYDTLAEINALSELLHPEEAFPNFRRILFDSADSFATLADRFLLDEDERRRLADDMRRVVVENYAYRPTMDHFLHAMAGYLRESVE